MLLSDIIDKVKMSESSKLIYRRFFNKIGIKEQSDLFDTIYESVEVWLR